MRQCHSDGKDIPKPSNQREQAIWEHKKVAFYKPRRKASGQKNSNSTCSLDSQTQKLINRFPLFNLPC